MQIVADNTHHDLQFSGDTIKEGDFICFQRRDIATDCSECPNLAYPEHGGVVTENAAGELVQNFNLDGDVDDRDVADTDEVPSGTFVLCVAEKDSFTGATPEAAHFTYAPQRPRRRDHARVHLLHRAPDT